MIELPNVSLIAADCVDYARVKKALDWCQREIRFGSVRLLADFEVNDPIITHVDKIASIEAYSDFMVYELHRYIDTDFVLSVQWDGFVWNPNLWDDEYLRYDYIGAPWKVEWLFPGVPKHFNVGNGGFSLRSKQLCEFIAQDRNLIRHGLEDVMICQLNRAYLEACGFRFAPEELAMKFSFESGEYRESFGVHKRIPLDRIIAFKNNMLQVVDSNPKSGVPG